jgi:hypothetical protein
MSRTVETPSSPASPRRKKPQARRRPRSSALTPLEEQILALLRETNEGPLSLRQIEDGLAGRGFGALDTFAVRDAVWSLIRKRQADFTPRRYVKAVGV